MNNLLMKNVLESLHAIKLSTHDMAETGIDEKLDEAIKLVEQYIESENQDVDKADEILFAIGKALELLPSIVALIHLIHR